ncbi:primosomal replication protein PriC, partial [Pantoea sp.]|uniref:primosomal replication protein PriC n=1 Tax=Pantoea sp. TaxID=69393 RepID=UPI0028998E31
MNSSSMRERLSQFIAALRQQILAMPDDAARLPRFDRQLFLSKGTRLQDYLAEIEQNFQQLCQNNEQPERAVWLAGRLVDQIAALQREASTQTLRLRRERPAQTQRLRA